MTYERINGQQNIGRTQARPNASASVRHYPAADPTVAQYVTRLSARGSENAPRNRASSEDLMKDACRKTAPQAQARRQSANVREASPAINNKYSPYSDVNVKAQASAVKAGGQVQSGAQRRPVQPQRAPQATMQRTNTASAVRQPAKKAPAAMQHKQTAVNSRRRDVSAPLAETGPREVALKSVPFPKLVFVILAFSLIFFLMIQSIVQNFEYQREITALQNQLESLNERADSLRLDLEERDDLAEIERRAEEIGMIKSNSIEEKYISLGHSDIIENFGEEKDDYGSLSTMLSAVSRQLSKFFGGQ